MASSRERRPWLGQGPRPGPGPGPEQEQVQAQAQAQEQGRPTTSPTKRASSTPPKTRRRGNCSSRAQCAGGCGWRRRLLPTSSLSRDRRGTGAAAAAVGEAEPRRCARRAGSSGSSGSRSSSSSGSRSSSNNGSSSNRSNSNWRGRRSREVQQRPRRGARSRCEEDSLVPPPPPPPPRPRPVAREAARGAGHRWRSERGWQRRGSLKKGA